MLTRTATTALASTAVTPIEHVLFVDVESFSEAEIIKVGPTLYAQHPSTEILCVAYGADNRPAKVWFPGMPVPAEVLRAARQLDWIITAHNSSFDRITWEVLLTPLHGSANSAGASLALLHGDGFGARPASKTGTTRFCSRPGSPERRRRREAYARDDAAAEVAPRAKAERYSAS
jgi:hypothetical protein